jgi:hypothetical protein
VRAGGVLPYGLLYNAFWKGVKSACLGGADFDILWRFRWAILMGSMRGGRGNARLLPSRALKVLVSPLLLDVEGFSARTGGSELKSLREHWIEHLGRIGVCRKARRFFIPFI